MGRRKPITMTTVSILCLQLLLLSAAVMTTTTTETPTTTTETPTTAAPLPSGEFLFFIVELFCRGILVLKGEKGVPDFFCCTITPVNLCNHRLSNQKLNCLYSIWYQLHLYLDPKVIHNL